MSSFLNVLGKLFATTGTGNPHFPNIREYNSSLRYYNSSCVAGMLGGERVEAALMDDCSIGGQQGVVGEFASDIEEGIPYITGNVLWAAYQEYIQI